MTTTSNTTKQEQEGILPPYASASEVKASTIQPSFTTTDPLVGALDARTGLFINKDGSLLLNGYPVHCLSQTDDPHRLLCYTEQPDGAGQPVATGDLLAAAYESGHAQAEHRDAWLAAYVRARAALNEALTLYAVTSVSSVLKNLKGSDDFLEAIDHVRAVLPRIPTQLESEETLFASCTCLAMEMRAVSDDFERGDFASYLPRIRGGRIFLEAILQVKKALMQLPLSPPPAQEYKDMPASDMHNAPATRSVIDKKEEYHPLRDEILKQIDWQQALFLAVLTAGGIFLSLALQPGVSGLVAMILPIVGLGLAIKLAAHDLRTGQINYHLRFVLKSPWEILRRLLFDGSEISQEEHQILKEQGIVVGATTQGKKPLAPPLPNMQMLANRIVFATIYATALGIGVIRTYQDILRADPLSIFIWLLAFAATGTTLYILRRKRVR